MQQYFRRLSYCNVHISLRTNIDHRIGLKYFSTASSAHVNLWDLEDNLGAQRRKSRRGRGPNHPIGKGKKGVKVRQGNRQIHRGHEGGQTPIHKAPQIIPYHKFDHNSPLDWLDLSRISTAIERGAINKQNVITMHDLVRSKCIHNIRNGLAIINNDIKYEVFPWKINIEVTFVTPAAKNAIENAGGIVRLKYYDVRSLRWLLRPHEFEFLPRHRLDTLPRPRWRHYFPDYPQLPVNPELEYLGKYQIHPELLPKNVEVEEKEEQERKLRQYKSRFPKPLFNTHTNLKDKLFRWSKPN